MTQLPAVLMTLTQDAPLSNLGLCPGQSEIRVAHAVASLGLHALLLLLLLLLLQLLDAIWKSVAD